MHTYYYYYYYLLRVWMGEHYLGARGGGFGGGGEDTVPCLAGLLHFAWSEWVHWMRGRRVLEMGNLFLLCGMSGEVEGRAQEGTWFRVFWEVRGWDI